VIVGFIMQSGYVDLIMIKASDFEGRVHLISILTCDVKEIYLSACDFVLSHSTIAKIGCSFAICLQKFLDVDNIAFE
jgi:hypothetical protein